MPLTVVQSCSTKALPDRSVRDDLWPLLRPSARAPRGRARRAPLALLVRPTTLAWPGVGGRRDSMSLPRVGRRRNPPRARQTASRSSLTAAGGSRRIDREARHGATPNTADLIDVWRRRPAQGGPISGCYTGCSTHRLTEADAKRVRALIGNVRARRAAAECAASSRTPTEHAPDAQVELPNSHPWLSVNVAVSCESIRISVVMSVLSRYTRYKNVYMADGPAWVQSARQYRHLLPSSAGTSIVFGGRPSTTSTSMRWPASGPRWRTAVIVGAVSVSEVPIFAWCILCRGGAFTALRPRRAFGCGRVATDAGGVAVGSAYVASGGSQGVDAPSRARREAGGALAG